ncbi:hypothetical protein DAPPUDRAFT_300901 [Daphnia pulex]|uniref:Uncharacterized protein n=1 Tax=Daphnia pulex TaxID=6669 RepID=E9I069_DAPPU|nr:hypothetical protein DAPPUDRAFT_300901 [Daphnia pulex]|eukprot:EFX62611.1 hypothetical protein DAPPUDRAFT_300901 [Daphnia pulex]
MSPPTITTIHFRKCLAIKTQKILISSHALMDSLVPGIKAFQRKEEKVSWRNQPLKRPRKEPKIWPLKQFQR